MTGDQPSMAALEPLSSMLPPNLDLDTDLAVASSDPRSIHSRRPHVSPTSPPRSATRAREPRFQRMSPRLGAMPPKDASSTAKSTAPPASKSMRLPPATSGRPLVPPTERKLRGEKTTLRTRKGSESDRWDITPDGGSAGREGRQFAVSNVGNNGRIYLRPTVRPAHQRYPPPSFVFPLTPPGPGGLNAPVDQGSAQKYEDTELHTSLWTPSPNESPLPSRQQYFNDASTPQRPSRHRRALSDSTIQEPTPVVEDENGAFKIVISKPADDKRPKTMEDADPLATPVLDIRIPSWRIGTPWFTSSGPMLRGSSYAPTEDHRNSGLSLLNRSHNELATPVRGLTARAPSALMVPQLRSPGLRSLPSPNFHSPAQPSPAAAGTHRATFMSTAHMTIEPSMFDELTFKPACDERHLVRYATVTGAVTAATPPRLVAEITSPTFLDYELISDFFLTYRAFLEPESLLRMLVARLQWAMSRGDETGMVVRVRTFVAIRHWILNYFMDDFVLDYDLRVTFCKLLNDFVEELSQEARSRTVQLKILAELKKCWRRVCAHYWDGPDFDDMLAPTAPIMPGGIAGFRDPSLDPSFWDRVEQENQVPQLENSFVFGGAMAGPTTLLAGTPRPDHVGESVTVQKRPSTPDQQTSTQPSPSSDPDFGPGSPFSMASMDVISCSIPGKALRSLNPLGGHPLAAHPAPSSSVYNQAGPIAQTPKALLGKRVRPKQPHQRQNSLSASSRDRESDTMSVKDKDFGTSAPHAGDIVRGNMFPPVQGFVDFPAPRRPGDTQRQTTVFHPQGVDITHGDAAQPDAMSSKGMKRLIGSVRRALSTRGHPMTSSTHNLIAMDTLGPRGATTNRLPGTAVVPTQGKSNGARPPIRIDLLGAEVAEDFQRVVREDAAVDAEQHGLAITQPPNSAPLLSRDPEYSAAHMDSIIRSGPQDLAKNRPFSDTGMTTGSKSIVIVDDTSIAPRRETTPKAPPTVSSSVEDFADRYVASGESVAPYQHMGGTDIPRRSSNLLNQHAQRPPTDEKTPPPFIPDLETLGRESSDYVASPAGEMRPIISSNREQRRPPLSGAHFHKHIRNKSSKTQHSANSVMMKRRASFSSGLAPPSMIQSIGATTFSEVSLPDHEPEVPIPEPLRILRRRPGGDLRKATNIGELDYVTLRRSQSVGSMTAYTDSMASFMRAPAPDVVGTRAPTTSDPTPHDRNQVFSVGQLAEKSKTTDSFFDRHSSKAVMRPSFEAEAQRLAQIPDDEDEGGVESALLKLEGRYEKKSPSLSTDEPSIITMDSQLAEVPPDAIGVAIGEPGFAQHKNTADQRHSNNTEGGSEPDVPEHNLTESPDPTEDASSFLDLPHRPYTGQQSFLSEGSQDSYPSIPLLERDIHDDLPTTGISKGWTDKSIFQGSDDEVSIVDTGKQHDDRRPISFEFIHKGGSTERVDIGETVAPQTEAASFLDDESIVGSDLSSEISEEAVTPHPLGHDPPAHPLREAPPPPPPASKAPSPSKASARIAQLDEEPRVTPELHMDQIWPDPPLKVSLDAVTSNGPSTSSPSLSDPQRSWAAHRSDSQPLDDSLGKFQTHLPFILAFESQVLAQQFTLIEKDALNEIDWKDLIDMNWKNSGSTDYRSWVRFLRNTDARGVEVVVARFNLMVKWAISEVVLTKDIEERARCIIKYIHIAAHCRKYRNFATMAQLTMALCSNEVSRLPLTWAMVPPQDMKTLQELETLVTPTRNFYNLRAEMEAGSDAGCIPFVGIYTHDLLFNAQRPSEIASSPTTPPLVNFERCRIGAAVVKTLLRLLEASTRYDFKPVEGITERCLWMGALSDDDIRRHSQMLE